MARGGNVLMRRGNPLPRERPQFLQQVASWRRIDIMAVFVGA
jgi:hypothetical protein